MVEAFWVRRGISLYARPSWIVVSVRDSDRYRTASAALSNDNPIGNSQFENPLLQFLFHLHLLCFVKGDVF